MDATRRQRWLTAWNVVLTVLLVGSWGLRKVDNIGHPGPRVWRDGPVVRLSAVDDGPYVVTHLVSGKDMASIDPPLAIIDSEGGEIDFSKLKWHDWKGEAVESPIDSGLDALYLRPLRTGR